VTQGPMPTLPREVVIMSRRRSSLYVGAEMAACEYPPAGQKSEKIEIISVI
jgi:hypothetical protein